MCQTCALGQQESCEGGLLLAIARQTIVFVASLSLLLAQDVYQRALVAFQKGRFEEVISLLDKLPEAEGSSAARHNLKALALAELRRYDQALAASRQAQQLDPINPTYVYNAGLVRFSKGDYLNAEEFFRDAIVRFPESTSLRRGLGETLFHLNRFAEAERVLREVVEMDPESSAAYVVLSKLYHAMGDQEQLEGASTKAIELDPENYLACYYHGMLLLEYRDRAVAGAKYIRKSIELQPRFVEALKTLGHIFSRQQRWADAARLYERAVAVDSQDRQLFYLLSVVYRRLDETQKADWALTEYRKLAQ